VNGKDYPEQDNSTQSSGAGFALDGDLRRTALSSHRFRRTGRSSGDEPLAS